MSLERAVSGGGFYPFSFEAFYDGFFCRVTLSEYERALGARLLAVNGICADEVFRRLSYLVSHENLYGLRHLGGRHINSNAAESGVSYVVSLIAYRSWPGFEGNALRPDIFVPLTLADVLAHRDPVLEVIKAR